MFIREGLYCFNRWEGSFKRWNYIQSLQEMYYTDLEIIYEMVKVKIFIIKGTVA